MLSDKSRVSSYHSVEPIVGPVRFIIGGQCRALDNGVRMTIFSPILDRLTVLNRFGSDPGSLRAET